MKWHCVKPGHWTAEGDGWEWHAWELVNPAGWEVTGWLGVDLWSYEVASLAEAKALAAKIRADVEAKP